MKSFWRVLEEVEDLGLDRYVQGETWPVGDHGWGPRARARAMPTAGAGRRRICGGSARRRRVIEEGQLRRSRRTCPYADFGDSGRLAGEEVLGSSERTAYGEQIVFHWDDN